MCSSASHCWMWHRRKKKKKSSYSCIPRQHSELGQACPGNQGAQVFSHDLEQVINTAGTRSPTYTSEAPAVANILTLKLFDVTN